MTNAEWAEYQKQGLHLRPDQQTSAHRAAQAAATKTELELRLTYQVRERDGSWVDIGTGIQIEGGALRYNKDGFGYIAAAGDWRLPMDNDNATILNQIGDLKRKEVIEVVKKAHNYQVWLGVCIVLFLILVLISSF